MNFPTFSGILSVAIIIIIIALIMQIIPLIIVGVVFLVFICLWFTYNSQVSNYVRFEDPKLNLLKQKIASVIPEIKRIELYGSNKSFTIDKKMSYICVKDSKGSYYDDNMLIYVILHELAHAISHGSAHDNTRDSTHDDAEWENNFNMLLQRAVEGGIYNPNIPLIDGYCGY